MDIRTGLVAKKITDKNGKLTTVWVHPVQDTPMYHGSVHEFKEFDVDKIGKGLGGKAFGRGVYTTDLMGLAQDYASTTFLYHKTKRYERSKTSNEYPVIMNLKINPDINIVSVDDEVPKEHLEYFKNNNADIALSDGGSMTYLNFAYGMTDHNQKLFEDLGIDGIMYPTSYDIKINQEHTLPNSMYTSYCIFDPKNIKIKSVDYFKPTKKECLAVIKDRFKKSGLMISEIIKDCEVGFISMEKAKELIIKTSKMYIDKHEELAKSDDMLQSIMSFNIISMVNDDMRDAIAMLDWAIENHSDEK